MSSGEFDLVVLGGGPGGQKAAIQAARAGSRVLVVDRARSLGGACVRFGVIPSKTLRETALALHKLKRLTGRMLEVRVPDRLALGSLLARREQIIGSHEQFVQAQLAKSGVAAWQGVAHFIAPDQIEVRTPNGSRERVRGRWFVIATGSHPRTPANVPVDHEHILDSDSILSLEELPLSLTVLGSGAIACEYASIFAALGVEVTLLDRAEVPLAFLDPELSREFISSFERLGGKFVGGRKFTRVAYDEKSSVQVDCDDGRLIRSEKLLSALGRGASISGLGLEVCGVRLNGRGFIEVDEYCRTTASHIYAVGDVIGPPALASTAMEQGRRAVCHALGIPQRQGRDLSPIGIYTIPEIASVGLTQSEASEKYEEIVVGRASFGEVARGQISAAEDGLLKLICDPQSGRVCGVHAIGESASELVHLGQMAMIGGARYDAFIDTVFNFPTFAEAYRVAALDILTQERGRNAAE